MATKLYYPLQNVKRGNKTSKKRFFLRKYFGREKDSEKYKILEDILSRHDKFCQKHSSAEKLNFIFFALDMILPDCYFGCKSNRKRFYSTVKKLIRRTKRECIYNAEFHENYDIKSITWLTADATNSKTELGIVNKWLMDYIVKPFVHCYFYAMPIINTSYGLTLIPKRNWFSFQSKVIHGMIKEKHLIPTSKTPATIRGRLRIVMKDDITNFKKYRPILQLSKNFFNVELKKKIRNLEQVVSELCCTKCGDIFKYWSEFVSKTSDKKISCAKVDIKDAFGTVNIEKLVNLLDNLVSRKKISYRFSDSIKDHIRNQYIAFQRTRKGSLRIGKWNHGLLQGDPLSSVLCQLYMSNLDRIQLRGFLNENSFLHRNVDDYLYCSTDKEAVERFIKIMNTVYNVNPNKIQSSLEENCNISYCGSLFLIETKEVKCHYDFKKQSLIKERCKLWNIDNEIPYDQPERFIRKALMFNSMNNYFKKLYINTQFNRKDTVIDNFFEGMIYIAFKFDAAFVAVYRNKMQNDNFPLKIVTDVIDKYAKISSNILQANEERLAWRKVFYKVAIQAFIIVLKKRNQMYKRITEYLQKEYRMCKLCSNVSLNLECYKKLPEPFTNLRIGSLIR